MPNDKKYDVELSNYRMDSAKEKLHAANVLLNEGLYKDAIGRSYYAIFSAVRSLLALDGVDYSKHAGVIAYFQKEYIKTGEIEAEYSKYLTKAFQIRSSCDYADYFLVYREDAENQIENAQKFIERIEVYIKENR